MSKGKVSLQNVISVAWHANTNNERSLKAGEVNCVEKAVDILLPLAKISGIITDKPTFRQQNLTFM
jgi:hypothetical protein